MSISVVLPTYNEAENILPMLRAVRQALGIRLTEIIVVDDDSPDKTWEKAERSEDPACRVLRRMDRRGLASALAEGIAASRGSIVVWMDCDLGMSAGDVPRLVDALDQSDVAIGSRYADGGADTRAALRARTSLLLNRFAGLVLDRRVRDYTSGFAAARRAVFDAVPLPANGYGDYFIEWAYRCLRRGLRVREVGYIFNERANGRSKTDPDLSTFLKLGFRYVTRVIHSRLSYAG